MPYTRSQANQAKRQRTASVAKRIPTALLTNILEMKHEMEVAEWREEHKQQFAPVLDVFARMCPRGWKILFEVRERGRRREDCTMPPFFLF